MSETGTIVLQLGARDGMTIKDVSSGLRSIEVAYFPEGQTARFFEPGDPMPTTEIRTQVYYDTDERLDEMRVFRP